MLQNLKQTYLMIFNKLSVFVTLVFFFILLSFFDLVGIGIMTNFISIIVNQGSENLIFSDFSKFFFIDFSNQKKIEIYCYLILLIFIFKNFLSIYFNYYVLNFSLKFSEKLRNQIINKLFLLKFETITSISNAEAIKIIGENISNFEGVIQSIIKLTSDLILVISIIILLLFVDYKSLLIISLIIIIFIYFFNFIYLSKLNEMGKNVNNNIEILFDNLSYSLKGYKEFLALKKKKFIQERYINAAKNIKSNRLKQKLISLLPRHFLEIIIIGFICVYILIFQSFNKELSSLVPILGAFSIAAIRLIPIFNQILSSINILKFSKNSIYNINKFLNYNESESSNTKQFTEFNEIIFTKVFFNYHNNEKKILKDINLKIEANKFIGIEGESGSGKTTFLNLLLGFLKPSSGSILINYKNDLSLINNFTNLLAYIPQEITIIKDSILKNIALSENISIDNIDKIKNICIDLGLSDIRTVDNFLLKKLEENGSNISGGQKQRIGIARALFHDRKILILDEITSSLDIESQEKILKILDKFKGKLTVLFVSHKKNSLKNCDIIYLIKNSKLLKN